MNMTASKWLANSLERHTQVASVTEVDRHFLYVERKEYGPVLSLVTSAQKVTAKLIQDGIHEQPDCTFVCNIPKHAVWEGPALSIAFQHGLGWGGVGDFMAALNAENVYRSEPKKYRFGARFLRQYGSILHTERLSDSVVKITMRDGSEYRVAMLYEYEMTADAVRTHFDKYGPFDFILRTNPNGGPTGEAREAAEQMDVSIVTYTELSEFVRET